MFFLDNVTWFESSGVLTLKLQVCCAHLFSVSFHTKQLYINLSLFVKYNLVLSYILSTQVGKTLLV